jgi:hypothetical protein
MCGGCELVSIEEMVVMNRKEGVDGHELMVEVFLGQSAATSFASNLQRTNYGAGSLEAVYQVYTLEGELAR